MAPYGSISCQLLYQLDIKVALANHRKQKMRVCLIYVIRRSLKLFDYIKYQSCVIEFCKKLGLPDLILYLSLYSLDVVVIENCH